MIIIIPLLSTDEVKPKKAIKAIVSSTVTANLVLGALDNPKADKTESKTVTTRVRCIPETAVICAAPEAVISL